MGISDIFRSIKYKVGDIQCAVDIAVGYVQNTADYASFCVEQTSNEIISNVEDCFNSVDWEPIQKALKKGGEKAFDLIMIARQEQIKEIEQNKNAINEKIKKSSDERLLQMAVNHIDIYVRNTAKEELEERGRHEELERAIIEFNSYLEKMRSADNEKLQKFIESGNKQYLTILAVEELKRREAD